MVPTLGCTVHKQMNNEKRIFSTWFLEWMWMWETSCISLKKLDMHCTWKWMCIAYWSDHKQKEMKNWWSWTLYRDEMSGQSIVPQENVEFWAYLSSAELPPTQTPERADSTRSVRMTASCTVGNKVRRWTKIFADSSWSSAKCSRTGRAKTSFHNPRFLSKRTEVPNCWAANRPARGTAAITWRLQHGNFSIVMPAHTQQND